MEANDLYSGGASRKIGERAGRVLVTPAGPDHNHPSEKGPVMAFHSLPAQPAPVNALQHALSLLSSGTLVTDSLGRIWRCKADGRDIHPRRAEHEDSKGYLRITLGVPHEKRTWHVQAHVVLWTHANGPIPEGMQINHKDLNKKNNALTNLEIVTGSENIRHSYANGRPRPWHKAVSWRGKPRVTPEMSAEIRSLRAAGMIYREIASRFNLSVTHVQRVCAATRKEVERA